MSNYIPELDVSSILNSLIGNYIFVVIGVLATFLFSFSRKKLKILPIKIFFKKTGLIKPNKKTYIAIPGFNATNVRINSSIDKLPDSIYLVGLLDSFAFNLTEKIMQKIYCHNDDEKKFELIIHNRFKNHEHPIISVGGPSVNGVTGSIISKSLIQREIWISYPDHVGSVLGKTYKTDGSSFDYGFIIITKNGWNREVGCCLIFGIYPCGTLAAAKVLESPMHYKLIEKLLYSKPVSTVQPTHSRNRIGKQLLQTAYVWLRLIIDPIWPFSALDKDWVIVVKSNIYGGTFYPGEPEIVYAGEIPTLNTITGGWSSGSELAFWRITALLSGLTGVAGDEPELSTEKVIDWIGKISFKDESILDFGCGPGRLFKGFFKAGPPARLVAIDREKKMIDRAKETFEHLKSPPANFECVVGDIRELENLLKDDKFNFVICWTVLNHIIDDGECESLLRALCKRSSREIITCDPVCENNCEPSISHEFPTKRRKIEFYKNIIKSEGFNVNQEIHTFGSKGHPEADRSVFRGVRS